MPHEFPPPQPLTRPAAPRRPYVAPTVQKLGTLDDRTLGMNGSNPDVGQSSPTRLGGG